MLIKRFIAPWLIVSALVIGHWSFRTDAAEPILPQDPPAPVPLAEAVSRMSLPEGFKVTLFAGEPDVVQPIAMATDERDRLWVIECLSYPSWTNKLGEDRVVIFEDKDGDGKFDSKKVFLNNGHNLTGLALGFGGVYLCSLPNFIFVPDRNRDDEPDGPPEILLDGWDIESKHNAFNSLTWGPDGWLYGCNGILGNSKIGKPGAALAERTPMNCGVWRWHPTRRAFEVVAHGTTNPWGIGFNEVGQMFVANCVIKHLFHIIPGARYERMFGQDLNPYAFELLPSCADHIHWAGGFWKTEGAASPQNDSAGGGHAHCGGMVYLGDNWPDRYRNTFFTLNIHGHRINNDVLERRGSGYVAKHSADLLKANDPWFRGVSLVCGPDGGVYMSDWSDAGECHDYEDIHRENGRIYKITYQRSEEEMRRNAPSVRFAVDGSRDLRAYADGELLKFQSVKNEWYAGQARRLLHERAVEGKIARGTFASLTNLVVNGNNLVHRCNALWCLNAIGALDEKLTLSLSNHKDDEVRAWTVRLALDSLQSPSGRLLDRFESMSAMDKSPIVRLALASGLQRLSNRDRLPIAEGLAAHAEDTSDPNLPLMIWYGIEPIASTDEKPAMALLSKAQIPLLRQFIAQRLALRMVLDPLSMLLSRTGDELLAADIIRGMFAALNGRRQIAMPKSWKEAANKLAAHDNAEIREDALLLSLIFGSADTAAALRTRAADLQVPTEERRRAVQALAQARTPGAAQLLQSMVRDEAVRGIAIRGLAAFDDAATPAIIFENYGRLKPEEKNEAINALASRESYAIALLEAVKSGTVPAADITPFSARQILAHKSLRIAELVPQTVGQIGPVSRQKASEIAHYRQVLTPDALKAANLSNGRAIFNRTCASCHTLFGEGAKIAPELTGSQRSNLQYLLENVVDPNAVVWNQYKATYFETADDRLITGIVLKENESAVTIQTQTGTVAVPVNEITSRRQSQLSLMPEGLLDTLGSQELLDLIAYLQSPAQVPLPEKR